MLFLKVTQAGSPAGELDTIGKWAWAQQDFDVLVGLYFYSERPGLAGAWNPPEFVVQALFIPTARGVACSLVLDQGHTLLTGESVPPEFSFWDRNFRPAPLFRGTEAECRTLALRKGAGFSSTPRSDRCVQRRNRARTRQYLRRTPTTRPWIFTSAAGTMRGAISEFAGCKRIFPPGSR